ncbi:MAG: LysR family transcriptional regulator [Myxococcaceae bacterium]
MDWLNYHHLLYFWVVAKEGSIARATRVLRLAQPTISAQLRTLEGALGERLFERRGRGLALTDTGRTVFRYAEGIFGLGQEMLEVVRGRPAGVPRRLEVGVADVVPKLIAYRLLEPALHMAQPVRLVCREDKPEKLIAALAVNELDVVLSDSPPGPSSRVKAYGHLLGECGVTIFGAKSLAAQYRKGFPRSLEGAPFLMPTDNTTLRRDLDRWLEERSLRPRVLAELEDAALTAVFGQAGVGLFALPGAVEAQAKQQYDVEVVGRLPGVRARFYAISVEKRLKHPAVVALTTAARNDLFR